MNRLEAALLETVVFLEGRSVPYMAIGGFSNLYWGRPRLTEDLDLKVSVPESDWDAFVDAVGQTFELLAADSKRFVRDTHVVPIATAQRVHVDVVMATLPYEEQAIARAAEVRVGGRSVRICTAEDLILHKIISDRRRDLDDVEGIIARQGMKLDRAYLDRWVQELAAGVERPEILDFYQGCLEKPGGLPKAGAE